MSYRTLYLMICVSIIAFASYSHAQPRQNKELKINIASSSLPLTDINGWAFNGEYWCGYKNVILTQYKNNSQTPLQTSIYNITEYGKENIVSIQTKKILLDSIPYYLLYITTWNSYYDYPSIQQGRHTRKDISVFGIDQVEWEKLWNMTDTVTRVKVQSIGSYWPGAPNKEWGATTEREVIKSCFSDSFNTEATTVPEFLQYYFYIKKEENMVRFYVPTTKILKEYREYYASKYPSLSLWEYEMIDFSRFYFEMPYARFKRLNI